MPIDKRNICDGQGTIFRGRGVVTEDEFLHAYTEHLTQEEETFKRSRFSFSDYTAATEIHVSPDAIREVAMLCEKASHINTDAVVATAASPGLPFGLARMAEMLRGSTGWESMVFENRKEAEVWIRQAVSERYGINDVSFD